MKVERIGWFMLEWLCVKKIYLRDNKDFFLFFLAYRVIMMVHSVVGEEEQI